MKNIHLISTDKPSRLMIDTIENKLYLQPILHDKTVNVLTHNIYITNDEKIKEGDWHINITNNKINKYNIGTLNPNRYNYRKIILTTDQLLDGVQAIDDEFLEWFVKNPSCEEIEIEIKPMFPMYSTFIESIDNPPFYGNLKRKIIIPKEEHPNQIKCYCGHTSYCDCSPLEEPKQEENEIIDISDHDGIGNAVDNLNNEPPQETTIEEVQLAILFHNTYENLAPNFGYETRADTKSFETTTPNGMLMIAVCKEIIKWQQKRMEEDLKDAFESGFTNGFNINSVTFEEWFEQFKKK